jgi:hypothetical protein
MGQITPSPLAEISPEDLLSGVGAGHLRFLAAHLVRWRRKAQGSDADRCLIDWVLRLLRRAKELGSEVDQEVARLLCDELEGLEEDLERKGEVGDLARFLRKWVVHGPTYVEKDFDIRKVYKWNRECGRNLDAVVYLTRLMRQRVDHLWEVAPPVGLWSPTVWSLVTGENGELSIASLADGALVAVAGDGRVLPWAPPGGEPGNLAAHELRLSSEARRLERIDSLKFEEKYQHGPYSRALWLCRIGGKDEEAPGKRGYLLVCCFKGWRRQDQEGPGKLQRMPRICVMRLLPMVDAEGRIERLSIEAVDSKDLCNELYSFCEIPVDEENDASCLTLVAGTSGSWIDPQKEGDWITLPFIELRIRLGTRSVSIEPTVVPFWRLQEGERSVFRQATIVPETAYNPCWAVTPSRVTHKDGRQENWVWAGFLDGNIRGYQRITAKGGPFWIEGGGEVPCRRGLHLKGGIWRLLELEGPGRKRLLAFGTGDGVVGAVFLDDLLTAPPGKPIKFLIHSRESTPITSLVDFHDLEDSQACPFLLAVTQGGVISIFSLDYILWDASERRRGFRIHYPGLRVERFRLNREVRALSWVGPRRWPPGRLPPHPPQFMVGSAEGRIQKYQLELPRYSERRRAEVAEIFCLMENAARRPVSRMIPQGFAAVESTEWVHRWLRILPVGEGLLRFSIWEELRQAGEPLWKGDAECGPVDLDPRYRRFRETVKRLANESYRRRPFSKEPAKMLWTEAGRIASAIAFRALSLGGEKDPRVDFLLQQYLDLNVIASDLCNRWIGVEQTLESTVLIHSFGAFFDWTAIILLATDQEPTETADKIRRFLVYNLIQRRLSFSDPVVPLETLRNINVAILRALVNHQRAHDPQGGLEAFRLVPSRQGPADERPSGFFDLMIMVGDLWERFAGSLLLTDPLASEILRFFSLCLLLLPESALLTGQVVSESRLTEEGSDLATLILEEAADLRVELQERWKESEHRAARLNQGLERFEAYIRESAALNLAEISLDSPLPPRSDPAWPWLRLAREAEEKIRQGVPLGQLSDESMMVEQYHILRAASWLSDLDRVPEQGQGELALWHLGERTYQQYPDQLQWLLNDDAVSKFFTHSREYLRGLTIHRQEIRYEARLVPPPKGWEGEPTIKAAIRHCDDLLEKLSSVYLFRPQRDHYEKVIRNWRDQLFKRALEAVEVLSLLDQFNRHVYRTSADRLLDNVLNLAMQTAPLSLLELDKDLLSKSPKLHSDQPLGHLIRPRLEGFPLIHQVFDATERLVESTHLAGMLLTVARDYIGTSEKVLPRAPSSVKVKDVQESFLEAARRFNLKDEKKTWIWGEGITPDMDVPGTQAIWDLIAGECSWNTSKYSRALSDGVGTDRPALHVSIHLGAGSERFVLISGNIPYLSTLDQYARAPWDALLRDNPESALKKMTKDLATFVEMRKRGHQDMQGGGMGLYLIWKITELFSMSTEILLYDAAWELGRKTTPLAEARSYPFCIKITWGLS